MYGWQFRMRKYNSNKMLRGIIDLKKPSSESSLFGHSQLPIGNKLTCDEPDFSKHSNLVK